MKRDDLFRNVLSAEMLMPARKTDSSSYPTIRKVRPESSKSYTSSRSRPFSAASTFSMDSSVVAPETKRAELIYAAETGDLFYIVTNIDKACKEKTKDGETLLHLAAENGHIDVVRMLLQADPMLVS